MCILVSTTKHPDYPFILVSNRDEYFSRPTKRAHFRELDNGTRLLAPLDLAREEHGTWIGVTTSGRISVLVNYTEPSQDKLAKVSRGILPLEYLCSDETADSWPDQLEKSLQNKSGGETNSMLRNIGGFSLLYGKLEINSETGQIDHLNILSNRGDRGRVHDHKLSGSRATSEEVRSHEDVAYQTVFGLSNSLFYEPWKKVEIGKDRLEQLVEKSISENMTHEEFIERCFDDVLSYDTFDSQGADNEKDIRKKFLELRKSVFIPPLRTGISNPSENGIYGSYYGTRTQTVIVLHKSGVLHYYEHDIHDSDTLDAEFAVKKQHFSFPISDK